MPATRLRAALKLKLADAVQAASTLAIGADTLVTHDRDFLLYATCVFSEPAREVAIRAEALVRLRGLEKVWRLCPAASPRIVRSFPGVSARLLSSPYKITTDLPRHMVDKRKRPTTSVSPRSFNHTPVSASSPQPDHLITE